MAVDNTNHALSLENVQTLTRTLEKDVLESASLVNSSVFEDLMINVITDIEHVNSVMVFDRHTGTTRRYVAGTDLANDIGYMHERPLKVVLSWNRIPDNIQNYREKQPFSVLGTNETYTAPNSEFAIRQIGIIYSGDVLNCLFFGDEALGDKHSLGLYDGFYTKIAQDINAGLISKEKGNFVTLDPIDGTNPASDYDTFVNFYNGLDPKLQAEEKIIVYCSVQTRMRIIQGYLSKYQGLQTPDAANPEFRFIETPNVQLLAHSALGTGDRLIATVPYNFEYGSDMSNPNHAFVRVQNSEKDFNVLIYQIQTAQGVRVRQVSSDKFCVSSGTNKPRNSQGGEYQLNTLTATSNDLTMGKVVVAPQKESYTKGETITLTPTPESLHKFVKWSDGATINPRQISFSGKPEHYQAIFAKE